MDFNKEDIFEKLQTGDRITKMKSLAKLIAKCIEDNSNIDEILILFDECYLYLLKCYSDRFESVRSKSAETVNVFMENLPPNDFHLLNVVSTLVERIGQQETLENSEEVRLLLVQQLLKLMNKFIRIGKKQSILQCHADIVQILNKTLRDTYPDVQLEACNCVIVLTSDVYQYKFKDSAAVLSKGLYGMLNHKHSQNRIMAINALSHVALHIDASGDALTRLIMEVSPLLMDQMPLVRRACGELGIHLLLELKDRYSYFERLIPLVLCCLKDDSPDVRAIILSGWIKCGQLYYEENETELSKQDLVDVIPSNYPSDIIRPTIGCRGLVQRSLRLLKLITKETFDWKENVRLHSLKLLYQFVLHAEVTMTANFFEIYPDVAKACQDNEATIASEAFKVSDLMGRLLKYEDWSEHAFEGLSRNAKHAYLKCFYYMYTPALGMTFKDNFRLSKILIQPEYSQTLKSDFQLYILRMVDTLLIKILDIDINISISSDIQEFYRNCYITTIKVMSICYDSEQMNCSEIEVKGNAILEIIGRHCHLSISNLHEKFFKSALKYVNIDSMLDNSSEPILLLNGLIQIAKFRESYLSELKNMINTVFKECADDAKVTIFSAISIAMLDWNSTMDRSIAHSSVLLKNFVTEVIEPHLQWKAGGNAEALRALATAALCSLSQGAADEAVFVLPNFAKYIPTLLEDNAIVTRHYAVKCLANFGELDMEDMKPIAYALMQRMDDPSAEVRALSVSVIPKLRPKFENIDEVQKDNKDKSYELGIWEKFLNHCLDLLFLHYDGPEKRLQKIIKSTLIEMSRSYPEICRNSYERTMKTTHNSFSLIELKEVLPY